MCTMPKGGQLMKGQIDVDKLMKVLSEILSDKYGAKITLTAVRKEEATAA